MSTPVSTPLMRSKIPRPIQSRTVTSKKLSSDINVQNTSGGIANSRSQMKETQNEIPKKACSEIKVQRRTDWIPKAKSDMKPQKKRTSHKKEPACRRHLLNDVQTEPIQQSHFNDIPFKPNKQALESILNNQGIVPGVNVRESTIQSGKRSSVYYLPPPSQSSMLKSHTEYLQNMKTLQEKLKQLNIVTPSMRTQDANLPSTPNQSSRPSSIYYKIKPLSVDKSERKATSMTLSDRKVLTAKNSEFNHQSTGKLESSHPGKSSLLQRSTRGKENKLIMTSAASCRKLQPLLEAVSPSADKKNEEHNESKDKVNLYLTAPGIKSEPVHTSSHCQSYPNNPLRQDDPDSTNSLRIGHEGLSVSTESLLSFNQISHKIPDAPLIPLSLLMTPTPPRSQVYQLLYSSSFTPSTPKYSSVLSTNTHSTWTVQDTVSTPKYSQLAVNSSVEREGMLTKDNSSYPQQAVQSLHSVQNVSLPYNSSDPHHVPLQTPTRPIVQTGATPLQTPTAPSLSSCLKINGASKSVDRTYVHGSSTASFAKKLRWADMSHS